jgi:hypothetical protein
MTAKWTASFPLLPSLRRSRLGKHFTVRQQGYSIKIQGYFRRSALSTPLRAFLNPKNDKITWMHGLMKSGTCAQTDIRRFAQSFNSAQHRKRTFVALATFLVHLHFLRSKAVIIMLLPSRNSRSMSIMSVAGPNLHVNVVSCCYTQSDCGSCFAFLASTSPLTREHPRGDQSPREPARLQDLRCSPCFAMANAEFEVLGGQSTNLWQKAIKALTYNWD